MTDQDGVQLDLSWTTCFSWVSGDLLLPFHFKMELTQRSTTGPANRNGFEQYVKYAHSFSLDLLSCLLNIDVLRFWKQGLECCHLVPSSLYQLISDIINKASLIMWQKYYIHHKPNPFCSSLVKNEPRWLRPEELKFKAKKESFFFGVNIDRTTRHCLQMETLDLLKFPV